MYANQRGCDGGRLYFDVGHAVVDLVGVHDVGLCLQCSVAVQSDFVDRVAGCSVLAPLDVSHFVNRVWANVCHIVSSLQP